MRLLDGDGGEERERLIDAVARENVLRTMALVHERSTPLAERLKAGTVGIVGAMYDIHSGALTFFNEGAERS